MRRFEDSAASAVCVDDFTSFSSNSSHGGSRDEEFNDDKRGDTTRQEEVSIKFRCCC